MSVLGVLKGPDGLQLELTDTDALWAARMVVGEESGPFSTPAGKTATVGGASWVVSAMLRRWIVVNHHRGPDDRLWPTFTDLLRAYSQPISPKWENRGDDSKQTRRKAVRELMWDEIAPHIRKTVTALFTGQRALDGAYTGLNHFADEALVTKGINEGKFLRRIPSPAKNWMTTDATGNRHKNISVKVVPAKQRPLPFLLLILATMAVVGS